MDSTALIGAANKISKFIRNCTKLHTTNPTLLSQARGVISLVEDKLTKLLSLYGSAYTTKKAVGYTDADNLKAEANISEKTNSLKIIEFTKTFNESIDLRKVKNHLDWIDEIPHAPVTNVSNLKVLASKNYLDATQQNLQFLLTPAAQVKKAYNCLTWEITQLFPIL